MGGRRPARPARRRHHGARRGAVARRCDPRWPPAGPRQDRGIGGRAAPAAPNRPAPGRARAPAHGRVGRSDRRPSRCGPARRACETGTHQPATGRCARRSRRPRGPARRPPRRPPPAVPCAAATRPPSPHLPRSGAARSATPGRSAGRAGPGGRPRGRAAQGSGDSCVVRGRRAARPPPPRPAPAVENPPRPTPVITAQELYRAASTTGESRP
ncbi:MAG: hypothetical protein QOC94_2484 [Actinoplanes sp.]|nr:hypothetical protein [Actinoplanes sp.]